MLDSGANSICATGTKQSPINMVAGQFNTMSAKEINLTIPDFPEGITFENLGTTVEGITEGSGAHITIGKTEFEMKQFHFHYPSEHLDNGTTMPSKSRPALRPREGGGEAIADGGGSGNAHGLPKRRGGDCGRRCLH